MSEIISNGKIVENAGVETIIYKIGNDEFRVGLSKGFNGVGDNQWVITAYQRSHQAQNFDQVATKVQSGNNLSTSGSGKILPQNAGKSQVAKKTIDELAKKSGGSAAKLGFLERLRTSVRGLGQEPQAAKGKFLVKDERGEAHFIDEKLATAWKEEFGLTNANDDFLPHFAPKIKEVLSSQGVDEIHLKIGSLVKLEARGCSEFIKHIKPTLQEPSFILKDANGVIFVKDLGDDKVIFTSIAKDFNGEWVVSTNSHKRIKTLENKIKNEGAEVLYQSKEASNLLVEAFTNTPFRAELDGTILAKNEGKSQASKLKSNLKLRKLLNSNLVTTKLLNAKKPNLVLTILCVLQLYNFVQTKFDFSKQTLTNIITKNHRFYS